MGKLKNLMTYKLLRMNIQSDIESKIDDTFIQSKDRTVHEKDIGNNLEKVSELYTSDDFDNFDTNDPDCQQKLLNKQGSFLIEKSIAIDDYEKEKLKMIQKFEEEKKILKSQYDREKLEIMRESERKDKIINQLTKIFNEKIEKRLKEQKKEIIAFYKDKDDCLKKIHHHLDNIMNSLTEIKENNQGNFPSNIDEFTNLQEQYTLWVNMGKHMSGSFQVEQNKLSEFLRKNRKTKRCSSSKILRQKENDDTEELQHELAQEYRKQKSELLELFNEEKMQHEKKIEKEKSEFEKDVRIEYENRMVVERKAWKDTIEDYEREIAILKFEREQMDRNYCIGMDEMKTEFELEKKSIHRQYSETHATLRRTLLRTIMENSEKESLEYNDKL